MHAANEPPDYHAGFDPSSHPDYAEVRAFSFGPSRNGCALLTLYPVDGGPHAFKMSVTSAQADAIRRALSPSGQKPHPPSYMERPTTHDFAKSVVDSCGAIVAQAAITHMVGDVFIARVWIRPPTQSLNINMDLTQQLIHVDARPSDALALATRAAAPLFLHRGLLAAWGVNIDAVRVDASQGRCELVDYSDARKSTHSLRSEYKGNPEVFALALLKARLDLAVRLQRFAEAAHIRDQIRRICPVDFLALELRKAVAEQRFADAARLQDELTLWRARLRQWEKGAVDLAQDATLGSDDGHHGGGRGKERGRGSDGQQGQQDSGMADV